MIKPNKLSKFGLGRRGLLKNKFTTDVRKLTFLLLNNKRERLLLMRALIKQSNSKATAL
jgi:hypothetical protein